MIITTLIIGCEIAFWLFVLGGLLCRYVFRRKRLGTLLLVGTPVVDLILLVVSFVDLRGGATATISHGVAAIYIGVSIAYGHRMVSWADQRFHHRFAGGPPPIKPPKNGIAHAQLVRHQWYRHLAAYAIGALLLYGMIALVDDGSRTVQLSQTLKVWGIVLGIDFLISFSYTLWPRKAKSNSSFKV